MSAQAQRTADDLQHMAQAMTLNQFLATQRVLAQAQPGALRRR